MLWPLEWRARQDGRWQARHKIGVAFDGQLSPFGANASHKPLASKGEAMLHQFGKQMLLGIFMGYEMRVGGDGQAICSTQIAKTSRTCQPPISTSKGSSSRESHKKKSCRFHVQTELSNSSIFLGPTRRNACQSDISEQDEKEEDTLFEKENGEDFWRMCGDFTPRHHEMQRAKLYIMDEITFSIP